MNSITEGKERELPPNTDGEILKEPMSAALDLKLEIDSAFAIRASGNTTDERPSSIESRTDLRLAASNEAMRTDATRNTEFQIVDRDTARKWVDLDVSDFGRIRSPARRERALDAIAGHSRESREYVEELGIRSPTIAKAVSELNESRQRQEEARAKLLSEQKQQARLSAATKARETLLDAAGLAAVASIRTKQTAALAQQLAGQASLSVEEPAAAQQAGRLGTQEGRDPRISDADQQDHAKRTIKRPIYDEELSQAILAKFIVSHEKRGLLDKGSTEFTFREGQRQGNVAFVDEGKTLNTRHDDKNTIRAMVEVAAAKNWAEVTLSGTDDFKRLAWLEAKLQGLEVRGYEPRAADNVLLAEMRERGKPANSITVSQRDRTSVDRPAASDTPRRHVDGDALTVNEKDVLDNSRRWMNSKDMGDAFTDATMRKLESRLRGERVYAGELMEHGHARYQFKDDNQPSYYVVLKTPSGEQVIWGKGLAEAMTERRQGESIVLMNIGKKDVVVQEQIRDASGRVVDRRPKDAQLNQWKSDLLSRYSEKARAAGTGLDGQAVPAMRVFDSSAPRSSQLRKPDPGHARAISESARVKHEPRPDRDR